MTKLVAGLKAMGLSIFGDLEHKMPVVTAINIPEGADGKAIRGMLLNEFGIEIATSFGPLDGKILRIGNMGYSSQKRNILLLLGTGGCNAEKWRQSFHRRGCGSSSGCLRKSWKIAKNKLFYTEVFPV